MSHTDRVSASLMSLLRAAQRADIEGLKRVIVAGEVPVNAMQATVPGDTALHGLARFAAREEKIRAGDSPVLMCARMLLDAGAAPNFRNASGTTPLELAIAARHLPLVELLIERGARVGTPEGMPGPMHMAASVGEPRILRALLDTGAPPNRMDGVGHTPVEYAARAGHLDAAALLADRLGGEDPALSIGSREAIGEAILNAAIHERFDVMLLLVRQFGMPAPRGNRGSLLHQLVEASRDCEAGILRALALLGSEARQAREMEEQLDSPHPVTGAKPAEHAAHVGAAELARALATLHTNRAPWPSGRPDRGPAP